MEKYYKNFILYGELNYSCLLCQECFMNITIVEKHIIWDVHKELVKKQEYIPKFRKDFIYKIPDGRYYCEICNEVFKKIDDHLKKETHQDLKKSKNSKKKRVQVAQYVNKFTVQILNENITLAKWHGIVDDKCLICDEPFGSLLDHVTSHYHVVRLIECETILENGNPYRKQGNNTFYCFICFKVYNKDALDAHWTECHHNVQKIREEKENRENTKKYLAISKYNSNLMVKNKNDKHFKFDESHTLVCVQCDKMIDLNVETFDGHIKRHITERSLKLCQANYIDKYKNKVKKDKKELRKYSNRNVSRKSLIKYFALNKSNKPECLKCKIVFDLNSDAIYSHVRRHERRRIIDCERHLEDKGKRRAELAEYGRKNFINLNRGGSMGYCTICTVYVSAHINSAQEHVKGSIHMGHLELNGIIAGQKHEALPYETIPQVNFIERSYGPFTVGDNTLTCINNIIFVRTISHELMSENFNFIDDVYKCYCCKEVVDGRLFNDHIARNRHVTCTSNFRVLLLPKNDDIEFIREFRPNLYHCGYCNKIYPFWENLKRHLKSFGHKEKRSTATELNEIYEIFFGECPNVICI